MRSQPSSHLRIARPSRDLARAAGFWVDGLGLEVLYRTGADAEGGHSLLMLGWPRAAWHLELVGDPGGETPPSSAEEVLLVLYVDGPIDKEVVHQLVRAGQQVAARNPQLGPVGSHRRRPRRIPPRLELSLLGVTERRPVNDPSPGRAPARDLDWTGLS